MNIMYRIFKDTALYLDMEALMWILQLLQKVPLVSYTLQTLSVVKTVTICIMDHSDSEQVRDRNTDPSHPNQRKKKSKGLSVLWEVLMHEGDGVTSEIADEAREKLTKILKHPRAHKKRY